MQNFFEIGGEMVYKLNINERAAVAIKNKTKRVEIRANKKGKIDYSKIVSNDIIEFTSNSLVVFYAEVKKNKLLQKS